MKVTETVEYTDALGSRFTSLVTQLQHISGNSSDVLPRLPVSAQVDPKTLGATIDALKLERWIDSNGATMDTTLCQQVTDWLQSKADFRGYAGAGLGRCAGQPILCPAGALSRRCHQKTTVATSWVSAPAGEK